MLGLYYRFQITSLLSILNRMTGVFLALVTAPLLLCWLLALASSAEVFMGLSTWLHSGLGRLIIAASVVSFSFHLLGGIRHLLWDAGWMLEIHQVRLSGWLAIVGSLLLSWLILGTAL